MIIATMPDKKRTITREFIILQMKEKVKISVYLFRLQVMHSQFKIPNTAQVQGTVLHTQILPKSFH